MKPSFDNKTLNPDKYLLRKKDRPILYKHEWTIING